ncbi:FtsK/SpoIIIE domain-containing protein [Mycobacterium sp. 4D054]|uniref:FtsK/SpoIIIE domain-containing protein n=1 Tax=Mycobacterium sp. 4D054 TaxID=3457440 RepID=UPI003FD229C6
MAWPMSAAQTHSPAWPGRRLLDALDVTDLDTFDPRPGWQHRADDDVLTIPVGAPVDAPDSVVSIELGDHANVALCVGITGKTTVLQSLALSVCTLYPPTRVQLAIADTQNGIATANTMTRPPHVVAHYAGYRFASDPPANWDTWCTQVETALDQRAGQPQPDLLVVVDAVDELLGSHPQVAGTLQRIVDEGRDKRVRLLMSSTERLCCKDWRQSEVGCRSAPIRRLLRNGG